MNAPLSPPPAPARVGKLRRALRLVAIAMAAALVMQIPSAQAQPSALKGPSDKQKAHDAEVRAYEKQTDKAYRDTLKQIPDAKPSADPWGNLRAAPPK
jgi:hypothetical protein